jgi:hypothetical protein
MQVGKRVDLVLSFGRRGARGIELTCLKAHTAASRGRGALRCRAACAATPIAVDINSERKLHVSMSACQRPSEIAVPRSHRCMRRVPGFCAGIRLIWGRFLRGNHHR